MDEKFTQAAKSGEQKILYQLRLQVKYMLHNLKHGLIFIFPLLKNAMKQYIQVAFNNLQISVFWNCCVSMQFINNKLCIETHQRIIITHTTSLINSCYLADVQKKYQHFRGDINKSPKMAFILSTSCSHALGSRCAYDILMRLPLWFQLVLLDFDNILQMTIMMENKRKILQPRISRVEIITAIKNINKLIWNKIADLSMPRHVFLVLHKSFKEVFPLSQN